MKKLAVTLCLLLAAMPLLLAGVPYAFNYQAVLRDAQGNIMVNQTVTVRIALTRDPDYPNATPDYEEDHVVNTGPYGVINLIVGTGTISGTAYYNTLEDLYQEPEDALTSSQKLYVQVDEGNGFVLIASQEFASVPYALQAKHAELPWKRFGAGRYFDGGAIAIGRGSRITGQEMFGVHGNFGANNYIGMYISSDLASAKTFYGYAPNNAPLAWHELEDTTWKLWINDGHKLKVNSKGNVGINLGNQPILSDLHIQQSGGNYTNPQTGGIDLRIDVFHWRIYNSDDYLRFSYSDNGGVSYTPKSYISSLDGSYNQTSDASMKKDVAPVGPVLGLVKQLKPYTYHYIDNADDDPLSIGFLAQDVQQLFPNFVSSEQGEKLLGIDYSKFAVVSIKAIQEQQAQIEALQAEIEALKLLIQQP